MKMKNYLLKDQACKEQKILKQIERKWFRRYNQY